MRTYEATLRSGAKVRFTADELNIQRATHSRELVGLKFEEGSLAYIDIAEIVAIVELPPSPN